MKKNQGSQFNTSKSGSRALRAKRIPLIAKIAAAVSFAMCILMLILFFIAKGTKPAGDKYALFVSSEDCDITDLSLNYSLASAGFEIIGMDASDTAIPSKLKDEAVVLIAIGSDSFNIADTLISNSENGIDGVCLIAPEYPGNAAVEGYSTVSPAIPIAVFGFDGDDDDSSEMDGPEMIFERISGVDTIYGTPASTGGAGSYKVYSSADMQRFLYLASDSSDVSGMLASSSFKTELARFLGLRFEGSYPSGGVNAWFVLRLIALFVALTGLMAYLFFIPVPTPDSGEKRLKGRDSLALIIVTGAAAWLTLCTVVIDIIPKIKRFAPYVIILSPTALILLMFILRAGYILSNKTTYKMRKEKITNFLIMAVLEVLIVFTALLVFTDIAVEKRSLSSYLVALAVFAINSFTCYFLALVDKKSRFNGEGPGSYYGNIIYPAGTLLPSVAGLIAALASSDPSLVQVSVLGIGIAVIPYLASQTIKRSSDFCFLAGLTHGLISAMLVFIAWK